MSRQFWVQWQPRLIHLSPNPILPQWFMNGTLRLTVSSLFLVSTFLCCGALLSATPKGKTTDDAPSRSERSLDFAEDVQPILRRHCYRCHGDKNQEASLQLNRRADAFGVGDSDEPVIVKGDPKESLLIKRIVNEDDGDIMPLDGDPLSAAEIELLKTWIDEGAVWPDEFADGKHWAYQPITSPELPADGGNATSPIDHFVNRRLAKRGLKPADPAEPARLLRRASLALVGIPPSPEEVAEFVANPSDEAYEKAIDQLLQSPRYGERWAIPWLDLARYADSNGFQADQIRDNWAYRDWVIRAFNQGMPFDQFVIEQIAGDLLPDATTEQKIATGFHRMTTCNVEAGVHPEANRTNQIVDRVNTTATVFLGTTMECAQCHDHKYDPFSQKDYYRLFAYFNNTPLEVRNTSGVTWDFFGPTMDLPMTDSLQQQSERLDVELAGLEKKRDELASSSEGDFANWIRQLRESSSDEEIWKPVRPLEFETTGGEEYTIGEDGAVLLSGTVPDVVEHIFTLPSITEPITAIRIEALTDDAIAGKGPGRGDATRTNIILSELTVEIVGDQGAQKLTLQRPTADFSQKGWPVAAAIDGDRKTGWAISPQFGKPHWAAFTFAEPVHLRPGIESMRVTLGQFYGRGRVMGKPRVSICNGDPALLDVDAKVRKLAQKGKRNDAERKKLRAAFDDHDPKLQRITQQIAAIEKKRKALKPDTTLVMVELDEPRETYVLLRGDYENRDERVSPGFPSVLPESADVKRTGDRLELARLLTSPQNPLLARVAVNRWWAELFGVGLVNTPEDFGTQAEDPSHPALLDWLASELIRSGWSMKEIHKRIVMSHTFRQSSRTTPALLAADPNNRLLARGPRFRIPAELIRDNALAIGGVLSEKMFGPPIMPYQPENIWRSVGRNQPKWVVAENEDRFRRGVYVICKRAAPYPSFINFDAPDRGNCTVRRSRSNTPLQALTLLNDPAYAEIALAFADRVLHEADDTSDAGRLTYAFRLAVSRAPTTFEVSVLQSLLEDERSVVAKNKSLAQQRTKLSYKGLELKTSDRAELAAWFAVTNALLNLDETMSQ